MTQLCVVIFVLVLSIISFKGKSLTDYTNLFSPNNFKKNDDKMLHYFLNKLSNG